MRITLLFILVFTIALGATPALEQEETFSVQAPETIEEAQEFGIQILQGLPNAMQEVWRTQALPLLTNMWNIAKNLWDTTVFSFVKGLLDQALSLL